MTFTSSGGVEADAGAFFEGKSRRSDNPMYVQRSNNAVLPANLGRELIIWVAAMHLRQLAALAEFRAVARTLQGLFPGS